MKIMMKSGKGREMDYAAIADSFATRNTEVESSSDEEDDKSQDENSESGESDDDSASTSDASNVEEGLDSAEAQSLKLPPSTEKCVFDLHNLLAMNSHQVDTSKLYSKKLESKNDEDVTISPNTLEVQVDEKFLLEEASAGCSQLIAALWQLPVERSDVGPMVTLPSFDSSKLPRELPPPPPKKETKWEKFAKERGIPLNKNKRSQKVWDEATGSWMYRHGYNKANDDSKEWPIMEVKAGDDPFADPWEKQRDAKRDRKDKNMESRMRNEERAGNLAKGTTNKVLKNRAKVREAGKAGGNSDRDNVPPTGLPVDLRPSKTSGPVNPTKRGMTSTMKALVATQRSTASLGRFDKVVEGEPERKKLASIAKKRKFEGSTDKKVVNTEAERSMKLFKSVVAGGGAEKEKARKKGKLAKGETAYDYDFDDGLGPSSFKKKKGRAGAGKMKKMTKKRVK